MSSPTTPPARRSRACETCLSTVKKEEEEEEEEVAVLVLAAMAVGD